MSFLVFALLSISVTGGLLIYGAGLRKAFRGLMFDIKEISLMKLIMMILFVISLPSFVIMWVLVEILNFRVIEDSKNIFKKINSLSREDIKCKILKKK